MIDPKMFDYIKKGAALVVGIAGAIWGGIKAGQKAAWRNEKKRRDHLDQMERERDQKIRRSKHG